MRLDSGDDDSDTLPNSWEIFYGLDPNDDGSVGVFNGPNGDPDGDGIPNRIEKTDGTDPVTPNAYGDLKFVGISESARMVIERMQGVDFELIYAEFNADGADDPREAQVKKESELPF